MVNMEKMVLVYISSNNNKLSQYFSLEKVSRKSVSSIANHPISGSQAFQFNLNIPTIPNICSVGKSGSVIISRLFTWISRPSSTMALVTATLPDTIHAFLSEQERLGRAGQMLDFHMEYLHYLCLKDIGACPTLLDSLLSEKKIEKTNDKKIFWIIPRYAYLLPLLPFFPVMFLFTGSGGLAFFITALSEMFIR